MKNLIIVTLITLALSSCMPVDVLIPTETFISSAITVTVSTNTPFPTDVVTGTNTNLGFLSGTVFLRGYYGNASSKPFSFGAKLREAGGNEIIAAHDLLQYRFENIPPGIYDLWILLPHLYVNLSNCFDIELQDNRWKLGMVLENSQTSSIVDLNYQEALIQAMTAIPPSQDSFEFYAVLENLEIKSGVTEINVVFYCK